MKSLKSRLITGYTNYTIHSADLYCLNTVVPLSHSYTNNVFIDNNRLIDDLKRNIVFKNESIVDSLISNKELLNCLSDTLNLISNNGLSFHADLDIVTEDIDDEPKLLLVYYPIQFSNNTNITVQQKELSDIPVNYLYRNLVRNLYKYSISIRKSVIIDEQFI